MAVSSTPTQIKIHTSVFFSFPFLLFKNRKSTPAAVTQTPTINKMIEISCIVSAPGTGIKSGMGKSIWMPPFYSLLKSDRIILRTAIAEKPAPIKPNMIAATGMDISPALLPWELETIAAIAKDETMVAIVDFFIIPTYSGNRPSRAADKAVITCVIRFAGLMVTNEKYLLAKDKQAN